MRIRPLEAADIGQLAQALAGIDPWLHLGYSAAALAGWLGRDDAALTRLAATRGGALAGVLGVRSPWLRGPYVELLAVLPGHQGFGLGRTLLDAAVERSGQAANLWACVSASNVPARNFYRRCGFAEVAPLPDLVADGEDEILLRKRLG
ncbi:MAG: N-acetyltransferase family protein [Actinomycetota bacterium]